MTRYAFRFSPATRIALAPLGVTPSTAYVAVDDRHVTVRWGLWRLRTPLANIAEVVEFDGLSPVKALGLRLSFADRGVTFGTSTQGGVCLRFHRPVAAALPFGLLRHPGATVTVADPAALAADVRARLS